MALPQAHSRPKTVAEYIASADKAAKPKLRELRKIVRAAAPGTTESLKWSMPAYSYRRIVVLFAAFSRHVSLFPSPSALREFKKPLAKFRTSTGTIQFPLDQPLPTSLIRRIVVFRVKESREKDGKWRALDRK